LDLNNDYLTITSRNVQQHEEGNLNLGSCNVFSLK